MNATNVKAALTTTIEKLVESKDLEAAPRNVPVLVGELAAAIAARELEAVVHARDIAAANSIPSVQQVPASESNASEK
jgi:hypothetical protein